MSEKSEVISQKVGGRKRKPEAEVKSPDAHKVRVGVLISGGGTNLQAIIDGCEAGAIPAEVAVVVSNRSDAYGLVRAKLHDIPNHWVDRRVCGSDEDYDRAVLDILRRHEVELVVLAGYMRLVGKPILEAFPRAVINLHPSLLPAFPGAHAVKDAVDYGVKVTGITIHFADENYDTGPIIIQEIVPVHQDDTESALLARIHQVEHRHLPYAVKLWVTGRLKVEGRKVKILPKTAAGRNA